MSLPDRNNAYSFNDFLEWRKNADYYEEDLFFQKALKFYTKEEFSKLDEIAREVSKKVSFKWKELSEKAAVPEKRPFITHYDGHNNRIDRIERPYETLIHEKEAFSEGFFQKELHHLKNFLKCF